VDLDGEQYWSDLRNTCEIPGCEGTMISVPDRDVVTIDYTYDPLYRLTAAVDGEGRKSL
jgi:hypothetical protein